MTTSRIMTTLRRIHAPTLPQVVALLAASAYLVWCWILSNVIEGYRGTVLQHVTTFASLDPVTIATGALWMSAALWVAALAIAVLRKIPRLNSGCERIVVVSDISQLANQYDDAQSLVANCNIRFPPPPAKTTA
jgi:hypothetical protein